MSPEFISTIAILSVFGLFAAFGATSFPSSSKKVNKRNDKEDVMNDSKVTLVLYPEQAEQLLKEHPEQANNLRPDDNGDHFFLEYTPDIDDFVKENPKINK